MRRSSSTVVVVAGEQAGRVVSGLDGLHNVRAVTRQDRTPEEFAELVRRGGMTYIVHDDDPLADVADAWVDFFEESSPAGRLEVAVEEAVGALRAGRLELPDYYIVLDPEEMPATRRHWWLGVLAGAAPSRVVPAPSSAARVADALGRLAAGRWWPEDTAGWLRGLPRAVPDRVGLPGGTVP
ncbi:hypothetical protein Arub01_56640 [Actinomadura rubrobrunea]|uniref:Uncharacterized protein n=1 Tax=Actinomadura rubrobrunea TaxID=115335 RepID=A0A9W6Q276_9ACTN|nr:hypothetical protein [Actinomadura rubrobrunea]GLW67421.1 hypothetical protein Arub01_56640 [Actinomadura rubrobrunea]